MRKSKAILRSVLLLAGSMVVFLVDAAVIVANFAQFMDKRLRFLSPGVDYTQQVVEDLVSDGVQESGNYVIANDHVSLEGLPDGR
jgi:hypothetical protein